MFDDVSVGKEWQEVEEEDSWKEEGRKEGRQSMEGHAYRTCRQAPRSDTI